METKRAGNGSMMVGLLFILLGIVFLVATQGTFGLNWGTIWPAFLMIAGILNLAQVPRLRETARAGSVMGGTTLLLLGAFFFTTTLDWTTWEDQGRLWPIYLLIGGVAALITFVTVAHGQRGYLVGGSVLTLLGLIFLGGSLSGLLYEGRFWELFSDWSRWGALSWIAPWWPLVLIVPGALLLLTAPTTAGPSERARSVSTGTSVLLLGLFFLATTLGFVDWSMQATLWPCYLLIIGAGLLAGWLAAGLEPLGYLRSGVILAAAGLVFQALMIPGYDRLGEWWPVLVILLGLLVVLGPRLRHSQR